LFGNTQNQQNQPAPLFGSTQQPQQQQQQPQQGGLFGGMQSHNMSFGVGNSTSNLNQSQAVQMSTFDSIKGTTRFNDLSPDIQQQIVQLDEIIQNKINNAHKTRESLPQHVDQVGTIAPDVAYVENFLSTVELGLDNDSANIASLKGLVKKDAEDAYLSFRAIENQALPPQFRYGNTPNLSTSTSKPGPGSSLDDDDPTKPVDLVGYFNRRTADLGSTLDLYQRQIREIEAHLRTMEAGTVEKAQQLTGSRSRPQDQRRELVGALQAIEGAILDSAKKVGKVRDEVTKHTMGSVGAGLL
jgi:nucleoporin p58/p45